MIITSFLSTQYDHKFLTDTMYNLAPNCMWAVRDGVLEWNDDPELKPKKSEIESAVNQAKIDWENTEYQRLRAREYPDFKEYLDGIVKGDTAQMQAYIDACLAVKAKYPKPEGVE